MKNNLYTLLAGVDSEVHYLKIYATKEERDSARYLLGFLLILAKDAEKLLREIENNE